MRHAENDSGWKWASILKAVKAVLIFVSVSKAYIPNYHNRVSKASNNLKLGYDSHVK